jgi:predicted GIY-YIG superfamily endonuclease
MARNRHRKSDFKFLRMWPREIFQAAKKKLTDDDEALGKPGVYILYREDEPYYIGKADDSLFERLHTHANVMTSRHYFHWTHFSAFAFDVNSSKTKRRIKEIEGILISALPRASNSAVPRWPPAKIPRELRALLKPKAMAARAGA